MIKLIRNMLDFFKPDYYKQKIKHLQPYLTFADYHQIWIIGILVLTITSLVPLMLVTGLHYQLIQRSVDSELVLRAERLASNTKRAVSFFLEERLNALRFTANELEYGRLTDEGHLEDVLKNLKLGFGGLTDLSVIDYSGKQKAYAGPYNLEGRNYSNQPWFLECRKHESYVSEIFRGYRNVPHIIIAVKSIKKDGSIYILRATLETARLIQTLSSYETGAHADIFLINKEGVVETPSKYFGDVFEQLSLAMPEYSDRTEVSMINDPKSGELIMGRAHIITKKADTPFILMVIKQKAGMLKVWEELRSQINWFVGSGVLVIMAVIFMACSYMINKIYRADKSKAETMVAMEQSNQLASIGQLAAGIAHEINNPLALINETAGYIKDLFMIKETYKNDEELIGYIDDIIEAVVRCGNITRQLLGFARRFEVQIRKVDVGALISDVLTFHEKEASYRNICVNVAIDQELKPIETDRGKLQQILLNLVNNAFQAVENGCCLNVKAENYGEYNISIEIADNGCGMPKEHLKKIFEPFFTTKKENKGTGLGLAITYGLVKKLHGDIKVKSKINEGTTFTIILPKRIQKEMLNHENPLGG